MSLRSQYVIGLYRDVNPIKNRCRPKIACPLGKVHRNKKSFSEATDNKESYNIIKDLPCQGEAKDALNFGVN